MLHIHLRAKNKDQGFKTNLRTQEKGCTFFNSEDNVKLLSYSMRFKILSLDISLFYLINKIQISLCKITVDV